MKVWSEALRTLRIGAGETQEQMAVHTQSSTQTIHLLERGKRNPSFEFVLRVADAYGIDRREWAKLALRQLDPEVYEVLFGKEAATLAVPDPVARKLVNITVDEQVLERLSISRSYLDNILSAHRRKAPPVKSKKTIAAGNIDQ